MVDVCVVGHVTRDIIKINGEVKELPGGTAYYTPIALKNLGMKVAVVTKINYEDKYLLDELNKNNIPVFLKRSSKTTVFENIYIDGHSAGRDRIQRVRSIATPFTVEEIISIPISPKIFHIGPLTKDDISLEVLKFLAKKSMISLDMQGFLREAVKGCVKMEDWKEKRKTLGYVDIIKANEMEAKIITNKKDAKEAARQLSSLGPKEVIITLGSDGSLIYSGGKFYRIPAYPQEKIVDPTGCGDTYMAGYIYKRLRTSSFFLDFNEIGKFANVVASLKLGKYGPFKDSAEKIESILKS